MLDPVLAPVLSRTGHDRDAGHRNDERWLAEAWPSARVLLLSDHATTPAALTDTSSQLRLRSAADVDATVPRTFLGQADGIAYFSVPAGPPAGDDAAGDDAGGADDRAAGDGAADDGAAGEEQWLGLRDLGGQLDDLGAGLLTSAVALTNWHATHQHCPRCGR